MQYVGARYVPKFMGAYDNTQAYENLCVVDNGMGTSYISKKPTPAGTPLTDTDYWAIYGSVSGAIINLQNQIGDLTDLTTRDKTNLVGAINEVNNPSKFYIFLGDSWAEPVQWAFPVWPELLASHLNLTSDDYLLLNDDGGGFADQGVNDYFIDCIENNIVTDHDVTDIIVAAGVNDRMLPVATIKAAVINFISRTKAIYPKANIYISCIGWAKSDTNSKAINTASYPAFKEGCIEGGGIWLEDPYYTLLYNSDFNDGLHPNQTGHEKVAYALYSSLTAGAYSQHERKQISVTPFTPFMLDNPVTLDVQHNHDTITALINSTDPRMYLTYSDGTNVTTGWRQIAVLDDPLIFGDYIQYDTIAEVISTNITGYVPISVRFETGGAIYIKPATTLTGCSHIVFSLNFTAPIRN